MTPSRRWNPIPRFSSTCCPCQASVRFRVREVTLTKVVGEAVVKGLGKARVIGKGTGQGAKRDATGGFKRPSVLSDDSLRHNTSDGSRICWNCTLKKGCSFAKAGEQCKRGYHVCMKCLQPRSLLVCLLGSTRVSPGGDRGSACC